MFLRAGGRMSSFPAEESFFQSILEGPSFSLCEAQILPAYIWEDLRTTARISLPRTIKNSYTFPTLVLTPPFILYSREGERTPSVPGSLTCIPG